MDCARLWILSLLRAELIEHTHSSCIDVDLTIPLTDSMNNGHVTAEEADKTMIGIPTQPHTPFLFM